jgi:uncharacterized protein
MPGKFEIEKSTDNQYFFRLRSSAGAILLTSETHGAKSSAQVGIASVKVNAPLDSRYERSLSIDKRYYFTLKGANGEKLGRSPLYSTAADRDAAIDATKKDAPGAATVDRT